MKNKNSKKYLNVEETIKLAKKEGIDFGTGEPYNRLRYYTKLGWLPHMERKGQNVEGHYPNWVIDRLKFIEKLKEEGLDNDEITERIEKRDRFQVFLRPLKSQNLKRKAIIGIVVAVLALVVLSEMDIIKIGASKKDFYPSQEGDTTIFP